MHLPSLRAPTLHPVRTSRRRLDPGSARPRSAVSEDPVKGPAAAARIRPAASLGTSALCEAAGVTRGALRLYERAGLINAPRRTAAGYRVFEPGTVERLAEIRAAREIGFTLAEIGEMLRLIEAPRVSAPAVRAMLEAKIADLDRRADRMARLRALLVAVATNPEILADPDCDLLARFVARP